MMGFLKRLAKLVLRIVALVLIAVLIIVPLYRVVDPPISTAMLGDLIGGRAYKTSWVPLKRVSRHLARAVVVAEDGRFCSHSGVDWREVKKVLDGIENGDRPRGASTLTMQLAKNLLLWPSRSYLRKGLEIPLAYYMDLVLGKRRVLEIYLNVVHWGPGIYGIGAAAEHHFGMPASGLGPYEASRLAVVLPNPAGRDPANLSPRLRRMARLIAGRARRSGGLLKCIYK